MLYSVCIRSILKFSDGTRTRIHNFRYFRLRRVQSQAAKPKLVVCPSVRPQRAGFVYPTSTRRHRVSHRRTNSHSYSLAYVAGFVSFSEKIGKWKVCVIIKPQPAPIVKPNRHEFNHQLTLTCFQIAFDDNPQAGRQVAEHMFIHYFFSGGDRHGVVIR